MRKESRSAWLSPFRWVSPFAVFLCLLMLSACGDGGTTMAEGPLIRLHVTPVATGVDKAVLNVTATDAMGISKTSANTFTMAPYDLLGVNFPLGTRGPATFQVDLFTGTCLVASGTATLTIDSDGVFELNVTTKAIPFCGNGVTLTVQIAKIQNGDGTVSSNPSGINCDATGKNCTLTVAKNTPVTLTATNTGGTMSSFNGWSGGGCTGTGNCVIPMDQDTVVQAVFTSCHQWCKETIPASVTANLNGVGGNGAGNVVIVGDSGTALNWDGSGWKTISLPGGQTPNLRGVAGKIGFGSVYVVGDTAKIFKWTTAPAPAPATISALTTASTANLNSVVLSAANIGYVTGSSGESLLIATNGAVTAGGLNVGTTTMNGICATSGGDFLVGGVKIVTNGVSAMWDGAKKTTLQMVSGPGVPGNIYAMLCGGTYHYAAGDGGVIVRRGSGAGQDNLWVTQNTGVTRAIRGLWSSSDSFIIAVGDMGTILQYDGTSWKTMNSGVTANLRAVWGTSPTNIFAVGDGGTVLHYTP